MEVVTGFGANVASNVFSGLWNNCFSGLWNRGVQVVKTAICFRQAVTDMEVQAQSLDDVVHDIKSELAQEQKAAKRTVQAWLNRADNAIECSQSIRNRYQQPKNCLICCPNCLSRCTISKDIVDWKLTVVQLHSERHSDNFPSSGEYGDHAPAAQIPIEIPKTGFVGNAIQSGQLKLEQLLTEDTNIRIIAVHGMGGVGKTSLLQNINNSLQVRNSFDLIIWVTVSKDWEISSLQDIIAKRLNLHNFPDTLEERKHSLNSYLGDRKFLMILDDMWKTLELHSLGVPLNNKGSKIVLTTRIRDVCTGMAAQEIMKVKPLSEGEGWQLFCRRAFPNVNVPQEIADVAREIAGECKGLPLAINVIAAAMRNHTYQHEWEHALRQLQSIDETFYGMHDEVEEKLFQHLQWSYNGLQNYLKTCFLSFAAYPEDSEIECEEVIDKWIAEGLVKGSGDSYLPDTAHSFINFLRDRCLIEVVEIDDVGRISVVKIHDVLRDLAIRIAEKEQRCYFKAGQGICDFPVEEVDGKGWERMSLVHNDLHSLPTTFAACSSLSVLLLNGNWGIKEVPGSFLRELSSLKVLDLSGTGITSLPPCVGNLKRLASLQLRYTNIRELPESIGSLKELQFLNVSHCDQLRCLPERISELKRLRALDIGGYEELRHLPRGISELVSLEILRIGYTAYPLDFEEDANAERKNACFKDLQSLRRLRVFKINIKSPVKEGVMGNWSKMRHLSLECTNQDYLPEDMQAMKDLEYFWLWGCNAERVPSWVSGFRKLACLRLQSCEQLKELPAELQELPCLRTLQLSGCNKLDELELGTGFPKLQELSICGLMSLECVGAGAAASGDGGLGEGASPLPTLKTLEIHACYNLKRMRGGWDKLKCLEVIKADIRERWDAIQWDDPTIKTSLECKLVLLKNW